MKRGWFIAVVLIVFVLILLTVLLIIEPNFLGKIIYTQHQCSDSDVGFEDPYLVVGNTEGGNYNSPEVEINRYNRTDYCVINSTAERQEHVGNLAEFYCGENGIVRVKYVDCEETYGEGASCKGTRPDGRYGRCVTTEEADYCGDKICNGEETCLTCAGDCGKCTNCFDNDAALEVKDTLSTKGVCRDDETTLTDYCQGSVVWESYCDELGVSCLQKTGYNCKTFGFEGCEAGKCYGVNENL